MGIRADHGRWHDGLLPGDRYVPPEEWESCFTRALRRVAVTINRGALKDAKLNVTDAVLEERFRHLDESLINERIEVPKQAPSSDSEMMRGEFADWFYGDLTLSKTQGEKYVCVRHRVTWAFLRGTYEGLYYPSQYSPDQLGVTPRASPSALMAEMGTNYLVKNLWHNYVHIKGQEITSHNFHAFRGRARFQSDFEADNLATILLVGSYGFPVKANSLAPVDESNQSIVRLLRRNRCNSVFAARAAKLNEAPPEDEVEWNYCRPIAVYLSGWLVACGRAASSLSVYVTQRPGAAKYLVAEVNGAYIPTPVHAALRRDGQARPSEDLKHRVATSVDEQYRKLLVENRGRRLAAAQALSGRLAQLGVS